MHRIEILSEYWSRKGIDQPARRMVPGDEYCKNVHVTKKTRDTLTVSDGGTRRVTGFYMFKQVREDV